MLDILPNITFKYLFVENVQGFELSDARDILLDVLAKIKFTYQEFLLNPVALGIPNSRSRYYMIAKHLSWSFELNPNQIMDKLPTFHKMGEDENSIVELVKNRHRERWLNYRKRREDVRMKVIMNF